ncbi:LysM domain protein [delta proteobacterium NaphS2]|nr:LysM domain protein [delta proteobacterium NaphS2]
MASDKTCPICGFQLISTDAANCPQCDADLTCFTVLDSIPDEMPVAPDVGEWKSENGGPKTEDRPLSSSLENPVSEKHFLGIWIFPGAVFLVLAGLMSGLLIAQSNQSEQSSPEVFKRFPMGIKIPVKTPSSYAPFDPSAFDGPGFFLKDAEEKQVESADFKKTSNTIRKGEIYTDYEVGENETLWRIAKKCYGNGFYFPVLMELNSGLGVYNLEKGARLKVLKDSGRAEHLYHQIVRVAGKRIWYGYRVINGDNFEGIAVKLYGSEGTVQRIMNDNPQASLQPGERIQVEVR